MVCQSNQIQRPQVIVAQALPQELEREALAVVHASLGGIIANDAVDEYDLLSFHCQSGTSRKLLECHTSP